MEDKLSELLLDSEFRKLLEQWPDTNAEKRLEITDRFGLKEKDVEEMYLVWVGTNFRKQTVPAEEIEKELSQTTLKIERRERQREANTFTTSRVITLFSRIAAILFVPLILYTAYLYFEKPDFTQQELQLVSVKGQPGTLTTVVLPDGTKVWLNSGSSVAYPIHFVGKSRNVSMTGEAYFEVVTNKAFPMVVSTGRFDVKVYGTKFNINAYDDKEISRVTLLEGSIALSGNEEGHNAEREIMMSPGQTASIHHDAKEVIFEQNDPLIYTAWKDGLLIFKNLSFDRVLEQLSLKYNVKIELKDKSLGTIPLDATFKGENINEILRLMSLSIPFEFHYGKNEMRGDGSYDKSTIYIVRK